MGLFASRKHLCALVALVTGTLMLGGVGRVWSSSFHVDPIRVFLSASSPTALLTVRNDSTVRLRFQVTAFSWDESPRGEMKLQPTDEVVFFPALLSLDPGEARKVRVGTVAPAAAQEKSYRIFVDELPSLQASQGGEVRILTRMGIPIFLRPQKLLAEGHIESMGIQRGQFSFHVANKGNSHLLLRRIRVHAHGAEGAVLLEREIKGWYILAGGHREYQLDLPKNECGKIKVLSVEVETDEKTFKKDLPATPSACN